MKRESDDTDVPSLRQQAEKRLSSGHYVVEAEEDPRLMLHKLQVSQIELEMQNEELRASRIEMDELREKYQDLYNFAPFGYFTLDVDGYIRDVNIRGADFLGMPRSQLRSLSFETFLSLPSRSVFRAFIAEIHTTTTKQSCELCLRRGGEHQAVFHAEGAPSGEISKGIRLVLMDVTARRQAEEALRHSRDELEIRVEERTRELSKTIEALNQEITVRESIEQALREEIAARVHTAEELREKDRMLMQQGRLAAMGEMIGNIAHQWRQPLNNLGLMIQQLPLSFETEDFTREYLESMVTQSTELIFHMSRTIDDFRNFFRPGKESILFRPREVIEKTVSLIREGIANEGIVIDTCWDDDPEVVGYPNEFSQAMLNIVLNARDALKERNIPQPEIAIRLGTEQGRAVIRVSDNAGGIPADIIDSIFDPYFTTKSPDKGTGMGLFMSKAIIEKNMGGSLSVCNNGAGAEFRMEI